MNALCLHFYETSLLIFFQVIILKTSIFCEMRVPFQQIILALIKKTLENFRHHVLAGHVKTVENASQTTKKESLRALVNLVLVEKLV